MNNFYIFLILFILTFIITFPILYITHPIYIYDNPAEYKTSKPNLGKIIGYSILFPFILSVVSLSILKSIQIKCLF